MNARRAVVVLMILAGTASLAQADKKKDKAAKALYRGMAESLDHTLVGRFSKKPIKDAIERVEKIEEMATDMHMPVPPRVARDLAKVIRKHAGRWADAALAPEKSTKLLTTFDKFIKKVAKGHKDDPDPDMDLGLIHTTLAVKLEELARGEPVDVPVTFSTAAKGFAAIGDRKASKKAYYLVEGGAHAAGGFEVHRPRSADA